MVAVNNTGQVYHTPDWTQVKKSLVQIKWAQHCPNMNQIFFLLISANFETIIHWVLQSFQNLDVVYICKPSKKQFLQKYLSYGSHFIPKYSKYTNLKHATQTCKDVFRFEICSFEQVVWPLFGQVFSHSRL